MITDSIQEDRELAEKVCKEIRRGNREAIVEIYQRFHPFFRRVVQKQMGSKGQKDDLLADFWLGLLNGNAICAYEGINNAALRTYLTKILLLRIIDLQRKIGRQEKRFVSPFVQEDDGEEDYLSKVAADSESSPDDLMIEKQRSRIFQNALLLLHEMSPPDANYIRMRMKGLTYAEMAEQDSDTDKTDIQAVGRKADAIKKQFTRKKTGSLAKFRIILENLMTESGMGIEDLL